MGEAGPQGGLGTWAEEHPAGVRGSERGSMPCEALGGAIPFLSLWDFTGAEASVLSTELCKPDPSWTSFKIAIVVMFSSWKLLTHPRKSGARQPCLHLWVLLSLTRLLPPTADWTTCLQLTDQSETQRLWVISQSQGEWNPLQREPKSDCLCVWGFWPFSMSARGSSPLGNPFTHHIAESSITRTPDLLPLEGTASLPVHSIG